MEGLDPFVLSLSMDERTKGHFGIGAYTSTLHYLNFGVSPWVMGGVLAVLFAIFISYPCFRLQGLFFALATITFAEVMRIVALCFKRLTTFGNGIFLVVHIYWSSPSSLRFTRQLKKGPWVSPSPQFLFDILFFLLHIKEQAIAEGEGEGKLRRKKI